VGGDDDGILKDTYFLLAFYSSMVKYFLSCSINRMGGIPAKSHKGEKLLLFMGIIDILQSYR
jgi:hypothetical protein